MAICIKPLLLALLIPLVASGGNLSLPVVRHKANCPPPSEAPCMMRSPTAAGFQVVGKSVSVEPQGDWWLVLFPDIKPESPKASFTVNASDGIVHEIAVTFAASQKSVAKPNEKVAEEAPLKALKTELSPVISLPRVRK